MKFDQFVKSQSHRKLKHLPNYKMLSKGYIPKYLNNLNLHNSEEVVGVYENYADQPLDECIVITTQGLYFFQEGIWNSIPYEQIAHMETPSIESKHIVKQIIIHLKTSQAFAVPIRGGQGRLRDAWAFINFLDRVIRVSNEELSTNK